MSNLHRTTQDKLACRSFTLDEAPQTFSMAEPMLAPTRNLFAEYLHVVIDEGAMPKSLNGPRRELAVELSERLEQLSFILPRVRELESEIPALQHEPVAGELYVESADERRAHVELRVLTESFYYFAARVRSIARNTDHPLPGLGSFECRGVRDVRNQLLEHPEGGASGILMVSFGRGGSQGPVIKPLRPVGREHVFPDGGLFANASEFSNALNALLQKALSASRE
jgi:hypothetical protein